MRLLYSFLPCRAYNPVCCKQLQAHLGHQSSLRRNALVHQAAAAVGTAPQVHQQYGAHAHHQQPYGGGQAAAATTTAPAASHLSAAAPAADAGAVQLLQPTAAAASTDAHGGFYEDSNVVPGTGGDGSSVCGDGAGSGYPAAAPVNPPPAVLVTNATFAGARYPNPVAPIQRPQEHHASSRLGVPPVIIVPNGNPGPGYIGTAAAASGGGTDTAATRGVSPFCEPGFQSVFLTASRLEQQQQQQQQQQTLSTPSAHAAAAGSVASDWRRPGSAAAVAASAAFAAENSDRGASGGPFQRPSLGLPVAGATADSGAQIIPCGPFQRPSLGVPVGAATVGLTDSHQLLVAGGSGPGIVMHLAGSSPGASSTGGGSTAGRGAGGRYRPQQHSARALNPRMSLLAGGSPASTVPGTPLMPGSHGTSLTGMHGGVGVSSRTSLGGAVLLAMDQEGGAVGTVLVPDMPRGDADSPTAQDAIEVRVGPWCSHNQAG